ncbi:MAG TPA: acyl-CoA desaturase [Hymenobacter sp.]|jgi:stearoyl-CoA desaturase (delta-9 desaturase)
MTTPDPRVPQQGTLSPSWLKIVWLYTMLFPTLVWGVQSLTLPRSLVSLALTFFTVCLGHSIGLHRGIIHKAYRCSRFTRGLFAYLFVFSGLGGPLSWVRVHYFRDYWQNQPQSPRYFRYDHSMLQDYYWNLHLSFHPTDLAVYEIPKEDLEDRWLMFLEKTWYLHVLALAALIWVFFGFGAMIICICARISLTILGHWLVGYSTHTTGYARYQIENANESAYNNYFLGLLSFGEGYHNNHHAHPKSAKMSTEWYEVDLAWGVVVCLKALGIVWDVGAVGETATQKPNAKPHSLKWMFPWLK